MTVQMIHVHLVQYVLTQKMDLVVYVHHGKMIALIVRDYFSMIER
jgi:hypothetical protein